MRIWTISPKYLDTKGLLAVWRETLLAKHVLEGKTIGYKNHPQLIRFKQTSDPIVYINMYLSFIYEEASARLFSFDKTKFTLFEYPVESLKVTDGQVQFELSHLRMKLSVRSPQLLHAVPSSCEDAEVVPLFSVISGGIESWEKSIAYIDL